MAVQAYVLIQTEGGLAADVTRRVREISGVVAAENVTGPYDIITSTEAESIDEIGQLVVSQIQRLDGITRTITCPVVNL